jgi:hypothetical protein
MKHRFADIIDADSWRRRVFTESGCTHEIVVRSVLLAAAQGLFLKRERFVVTVDGRQLPEQYSDRYAAFEAGHFALENAR